MVERINRAVADCLILCAYSQKPPRAAADDFLLQLQRDPLWEEEEARRVRQLVEGLLDRLHRDAHDDEGWVKGGLR